MVASAPSGPSPLAGNLRPAMMTGVRWLVIGHRWLGIATCILCALWFVSGVVMIYVPYPNLSDRDRMAYSEPLDLKRIAVAPGDALAAAGAGGFPAAFKLNMLRGEPVYRVLADGERTTVSAVDGRRIAGVDADQAADVVRRLLPGRSLGKVERIVRDQWTVAQGFDPHRPLYRIQVQGREGLVLYVSSRTGEVVNDTRAGERAWNYLGSIIHWIYPTELRRDNEAWRQVIMWTSGPATLGAATGIWLGILRLRLRRKPGQPMSPYRGWMNWHHWTGLVGGLFCAGWLLSGWLSVNPFRLFQREQASPAAVARYAGQDAARFDAPLAVLAALPPGAREARLSWAAGRPLITLMGTDLRQTALDARTGAPAGLTDAALFSAARALVPYAPVAFTRRLTQPDDYWYSHRNNQRRLPVLRIGFLDAKRTWFHIDPTTGDILSRTDDSGRAYRWWFNLLHDLDLPILLRHRPLWDLVMWGLSIVGLVVSVSGVVIGWRRLAMKFGPPPKTRRRAARRQDKTAQGRALT